MRACYKLHKKLNRATQDIGYYVYSVSTFLFDGKGPCHRLQMFKFLKSLTWYGESFMRFYIAMLHYRALYSTSLDFKLLLNHQYSMLFQVLAVDGGVVVTLETLFLHHITMVQTQE